MQSATLRSRATHGVAPKPRGHGVARNQVGMEFPQNPALRQLHNQHSFGFGFSVQDFADVLAKVALNLVGRFVC